MVLDQEIKIDDTEKKAIANPPKEIGCLYFSLISKETEHPLEIHYECTTQYIYEGLLLIY